MASGTLLVAVVLLLACGMPLVASLVCKKGAAPDFYKSRCMQCSGPRFEVRKDGRCFCGKGYEGRTIFDGRSLKQCTKCPAGFTTTVTFNEDNACVCADRRKGAVQSPKSSSWDKCACRWGFKPQGATCAYAGLCASKKPKLDFWFAKDTPKGWTGARFPSAVLAKKPSWSTTTSISKDGTVAWPSSYPASWRAEDGYRVAVRITACACVTHKDWDSQFAYTLQAAKLSEGSAKVVIDGGQRTKYSGDYYDQNVRYRPGKRPVLPVQSGYLTKSGSATVKAPQYEDTMGGFLSGMDSIPNVKDYEACHKVEVFYSTPGRNLATLKLALPK